MKESGWERFRTVGASSGGEAKPGLRVYAAVLCVCIFSGVLLAYLLLLFGWGRVRTLMILTGTRITGISNTEEALLYKVVPALLGGLPGLLVGTVLCVKIFRSSHRKK